MLYLRNHSVAIAIFSREEPKKGPKYTREPIFIHKCRSESFRNCPPCIPRSLFSPRHKGMKMRRFLGKWVCYSYTSAADIQRSACTQFAQAISLCKVTIYSLAPILSFPLGLPTAFRAAIRRSSDEVVENQRAFFSSWPF